MANFTRKAIKDTFISLLEERPLSKITIKDIVETCGINRNSFYYHFRDLPALVKEIVEEEAENIIKKYPSVDSIVNCFDALIEFSSNHKKAIMHIYRSINREVFDQNLMSVSEYLVKKYFQQAFLDLIVTESDRNIITEYYKYVFVGLILGWLNNGMSEQYARDIRKMFSLKKNYALEITELLKNQI